VRESDAVVATGPHSQATVDRSLMQVLSSVS